MAMKLAVLVIACYLCTACANNDESLRKLPTGGPTGPTPSTPLMSWAELQKACASDCTVHLSPKFTMDGYNGAPMSISQKKVVIFGGNASLDAGFRGPFFSDSVVSLTSPTGASTSLELHNLVLKSGGRGYDKCGDCDSIACDTYAPAGCPPPSQCVTCSAQASIELINGGSLLLVDTTISGGNNDAIVAQSANITIHGSTFEDNRANLDSGAIEVGNCWLEIYNTAFVRNSVHQTGCDWCQTGCGAINIALGNANIVDCTFDSNTCAGGTGGAVHIYADPRYKTQATMSFTGCTFAGNQNKTGSNDISNDAGANVTFHCPAGTTGPAVMMEGTELLNGTPAALRCTPAKS